MSVLSAIDTWLYETLTGDGTLVDLLASATSVFVDRAVQGAARPYVTCEVQLGHDVMGVGTVRLMTRAEYMVRAVTESTSFASADAIMERADYLLHGAAIENNADGTILSCVRDMPLRGIDDYPGGVEVRWAGGVYVIQCQVVEA